MATTLNGKIDFIRTSKDNKVITVHKSNENFKTSWESMVLGMAGNMGTVEWAENLTTLEKKVTNAESGYPELKGAEKITLDVTLSDGYNAIMEFDKVDNSFIANLRSFKVKVRHPRKPVTRDSEKSEDEV